MPLADEIIAARYVSFATFRRDGRRVATPVWAAPLDDSLVLFSAGEAGKIKRLRNSARSQLAPCDVRGQLEGEWQATTATIMAPAEIATAHRALQHKYGWQLAMLDMISTLSGRLKQRAYVRVVAAVAQAPE